MIREPPGGNQNYSTERIVDARGCHYPVTLWVQDGNTGVCVPSVPLHPQRTPAAGAGASIAGRFPDKRHNAKRLHKGAFLGKPGARLLTIFGSYVLVLGH